MKFTARRLSTQRKVCTTNDNYFAIKNTSHNIYKTWTRTFQLKVCFFLESYNSRLSRLSKIVKDIQNLFRHLACCRHVKIFNYRTFSFLDVSCSLAYISCWVKGIKERKVIIKEKRTNKLILSSLVCIHSFGS